MDDKKEKERGNAVVKDQTGKELAVYLVTAFAGAWALQLLASTVGRQIYQLLLAASMLVPMLGVWLAKKGLGREKTGIGWKLSLKNNWKLFLLAWLLPMLLTAMGALLYFLIFSGEFDAGCGYLIRQYEAMGAPVADGKLNGVPIPTLVAVSCVQALTYAPLVNALFAVGEEVGWRGYMTPVFKEWFGERAGVLAAGVVWGLWHAPVIVLIGYEYGFGYFGAPVSGILLFCVITTAIGIILSRLYEKTGCIWVPALFHGGFNAAATIPVCFTDGTGTDTFLGPAPNGLIAGIPLMLAAAVVFLYAGKRKPESKV